MVGGRLWGLISCHHYSPQFLHFEMRSVCEVLAEVIGTRIAALESFMRGQGELAARRLEQRITEWIGRDGDWRGALFDRTRPLLLPLGANGAALLFENEVSTTGDVPGTEEIRECRAGSAPSSKRRSYQRRVSALRKRRSRRWRSRQRHCRCAYFGSGGRDADLVPRRTRSHRHLGRQSLQIAFVRGQSIGSFSTTFFCPVASNRKGHLRSLDRCDLSAARLIRGERDRRHSSIPRGPHLDRAGPA